MKKVTTNITSGQIFFILFTFLCSSLITFYLGAKFGPEILDLPKNYVEKDIPILPDEQIALEIEDILAKKKSDFVFYEELQGKKSKEKSVIPEPEVVKEKKNKPVEKVTITKTTPSEKKTVKAVKKEVTKTNKNEVITKKIGALNVKIAKPKIIDTTKEIKKTAAVIKEVEEIKTEPTLSPQYSLQLGSYSEMKKADKAKALWKKRGYKVSIVDSEVPNKGVWYRLKIGAYITLEDALTAQKKMMKKFRQSSRIVSLK